MNPRRRRHQRLRSRARKRAAAMRDWLRNTFAPPAFVLSETEIRSLLDLIEP